MALNSRGKALGKDDSVTPSTVSNMSDVFDRLGEHSGENSYGIRGPSMAERLPLERTTLSL